MSIEIPEPILETYMLWRATYPHKLDRVETISQLKNVISTSPDRLNPHDVAALYGPLVPGCEMCSSSRLKIDIAYRRAGTRAKPLLKVEAIFGRLKNPLHFPQPPALDVDKVIISPHAVDRFNERYKNDIVLVIAGVAPEKLLRCFLGMSQKESLQSVIHVKRLIRHQAEEAHYYRLGDYRFVVVAEPGDLPDTTILCLRTFEYINQTRVPRRPNFLTRGARR